MLPEHGEDRQSERGGLSGPGLGSADQIFAGEDDWESAQLDWRRVDKSHRLHAVDDLFGKAKILE
jgi:hypothetical protein